MQISVIGNVATIKSDINYKELAHLKEVTIPVGDDKFYTVRIGAVISESTMSFSNESADGKAILQLICETATPIEVLMENRKAIEAFKAHEAELVSKISEEIAKEAEFVNSINLD